VALLIVIAFCITLLIKYSAFWKLYHFVLQLHCTSASGQFPLHARFRETCVLFIDRSYHWKHRNHLAREN